MTKTSTATRTANTKTNIARLRRAFDIQEIAIQVDYEFLYLGYWEKDESGEECFILSAEPICDHSYTFSKDAIEQGTIHQNTASMTADDGQEHLLTFFSTKAARL